MAKHLQKHIHWIFCSVILLVIALFGFFNTNYFNMSFSITHDYGETEISPYQSESGEYFVFLPSHTALSQVKAILPPNASVFFGETPVSNGMICENFDLGTPYPLIVDDHHVTTIQFHQSANVATMYINTASGSMERIHENKKYSESANITLFTANGIPTTIYDATIKGRGNATWGLEKRPYSLQFSSPVNLLGMGNACNWILLANALDETNLNNKLAMELARSTGGSWTPESTYVDVYLNGEYNGLYLLTEKTEVGPSRLDINPSAGDFLCKIDLGSRWDVLDNPVETQLGRTVDIVSPETPTPSEKASIQMSVNELEQIITSGADLSVIENFDFHSWAWRYLIDEVCANIDSDLASSYFYSSNGIFYAGPIWDYDMTFGNSPRNQNPHAFIAKNKYKADSYISEYYDALYNNESFYLYMVEQYQTNFLPVINEMLDGGIQNLAHTIQDAAKNNSLRWRHMYDALQKRNPNGVRTAADLVSYLETRTAFLTSAWVEHEPYYTVQFESVDGDSFWNVSVKKGDRLETNYVDLKNTIWIDSVSGQPVSFEDPIYADMILVLPTLPEETNEDAPAEFATRDYLVFFSVGSLLCIMVFLFATDSRRRRKGNHGRPTQTDIHK